MSNFSPIDITCFKAYDIRGKLNVNLDNTIAYRIGRGFGQYLLATKPSDVSATIVIGADIRHSSVALKKSALDGILDSGVNVIDLGMTGTEEVYFYTSYYKAMGGIEITASHNPIDFNGMKLVREHSKPISSQTGLADIQRLAESGEFNSPKRGNYTLNTDKTAYIDHLMSYIDIRNLSLDKPLKIIVNAGNGSAGPVLDLLIERLTNTSLQFIKLHHEPDGNFPNGIPNPMIIANRTPTMDLIRQQNADLAVAFDGDFDRCFFFDENARFIEGAYLVGVLAKAFLDKEPNSGIVYDPRTILNTEHIIKTCGGVAVMSQSGHSFIKEVMRDARAIYGGEMSAHHYFRDFNYCDSGMITWLLVVELLAKSGKKLSELVDEMIDNFPISGEINFKLNTITAPELLAKLKQNRDLFGENASLNEIDGLSLDFDNWRFNIRASNTEPLVRLNIETIGDKKLLDEKTQAICQWIIDNGGVRADH
ncbi:phosphomannomutase [Moraxella macacae 0408225]|uniref:phosphomannomutase n=1 Tax=Moraxella macacae 0408225 TaxID=1230338 RepID=L2F7U0_9GAMM|nr:phosphomannomutase/phosphoglucomutase [Moraxella macacae]ELA09087.1 phosphomannomutase [Moraxella macacae 0408225]